MMGLWSFNRSVTVISDSCGQSYSTEFSATCMSTPLLLYQSRSLCASGRSGFRISVEWFLNFRHFVPQYSCTLASYKKSLLYVLQKVNLLIPMLVIFFTLMQTTGLEDTSNLSAGSFHSSKTICTRKYY